MKQKDFFKRVAEAWGDELAKKLYRAYWLSKRIHENQKRDTQERYFEHCRAVMEIYWAHEINPTIDASIVALLHDANEDGHPPENLIRDLFGQYVDDGIKTLSKYDLEYDFYGRVAHKHKKELPVYYQSISDAPYSIRVIKLANRLHNMKTLADWPLARQEKYLKETRQYLLPIARATNSGLLFKLDAECEKIQKRLLKA